MYASNKDSYWVIKYYNRILNNWFICLLFISSLKITLSVWIFIYSKVFLYIKTKNLEGTWGDTLLLAEKIRHEKAATSYLIAAFSMRLVRYSINSHGGLKP